MISASEINTSKEKQRKLFEKALTESQTLDKALLTLSSSALGLCVVFIKDGTLKPKTVYFLVIGTILLLITVFCTLLSLDCSIRKSLKIHGKQ